MEIEVTESDIRDGVMKDIHKCPVALAVKRAFPKNEISVSYEVIQIDNSFYWTDKQLEDFILAFDMGKEVKPFKFYTENLYYWGRI